MEVINTAEIADIEQATEVINDLQMRLIEREKCMDDLVRAMEIAQYSRNFDVLEQFASEAKAQLEDRLIIPHPEDDEDPMKVVLIQ